MQAFMKMGAESRETGRLPGEDEMSNKTSVISPADIWSADPRVFDQACRRRVGKSREYDHCQSKLGGDA
jgi:hypothetical protein